MTDDEMNPDICTSALEEDGTLDRTKWDGAHKWYRGGKCEECGHTRKPAFLCPLCDDGGVYHYKINGTDIYACDETCPFIALEYYRDENIEALQEYLKLPADR